MPALSELRRGYLDGSVLDLRTQLFHREPSMHYTNFDHFVEAAKYEDLIEERLAKLVERETNGQKETGR